MKLLILVLALIALPAAAWAQESSRPAGGQRPATPVGTHAAEAVTFTDVGAGLPGVRSGSVVWGDYDNDGRLDILLAGVSGSGGLARVFHNNGDGTFTDIHAGLPGSEGCSAAWGDYDNDGYLDIALAGWTASAPFSRVYHNNRDGTFTDIIAGLPGTYNGAVAWGDYDNDGRLDILLVGATSGDGSNPPQISRVFRNNGNGTFSDINAGLAGTSWSSAAWGDYDNDGHLDILTGGRVYYNDGDGTFTDINAGLPAQALNWAAWGDYDSDGYLDIAVAGNLTSTVLHNNANGTFTDIHAGLAAWARGAVVWGDYDNDGRPDILIPEWPASTVIYRNNGDGTFTDINAGLASVVEASAASGDYDNDGDLDILVTGQTPYGYISTVYRSDGAPANTPPTVPSGLGAQVVGDNVTLSWNASTDLQTPSAGLSYNLRIGITPGGNEITSAMAAANGYRRVVQLGNAQQRTSWTLSLPQGVSAIDWSVQAVDGAFAGSLFSLEQAWARPTGGIIAVCTAPGNQGGAQVVSDGAGGAIITWQDERSGSTKIYAQHVLTQGWVDPAWPADGRALCTAPGAQTHSVTISDGAGGAIVAWQDGRSGNPHIYAQCVLASGIVDPAWPTDGRACSDPAGSQWTPLIASDGAHGAIILWIDGPDSTSGGVYVHHVLGSGGLDSTWPTGGRGVGGATGFFWDRIAVLAADGAGGAFVAWNDPRFRDYGGCMPGGGTSVYAQHVLASGQTDSAWPADGLAIDVGGCGYYMEELLAASDGVGGAFFTYRESKPVHWGCPEIVSVPASGAGWSQECLVGLPYEICPADAGRAFVATRGGALQGSQTLLAIRLQRVLASVGPDPSWPDTGSLLLTYAGGTIGTDPEGVAVAADGLGGALVTWEDRRGGASYPEIYVQHVLANGDVDPNCPVNGRRLSWSACTAPQVVGDGAGGGIVVWGCGDIYAARLLGPFPTPVLAALVSAEATAERARLVWSCSGSVGLTATIYRRTEPGAWQSIGRVSPDGTGHLVFVDRDVRPGTRYGYRLGIPEDGTEVFRGETWLTIPIEAVLALRGLQPNPAVAGISVAFSLKDDGPARLELLDVSGRRVFEKQVGALGPGAHVVKLEEGSRLPPGVYVIRLTHAGRTLVARGVLVK